MNAEAANLEVVLATWNGARHLDELLLSIRAQSLRPKRLLVRDDGSSDRTREILKDSAERWPGWLIELPGKCRLGSNGNFAALLAESQAEFVAHKTAGGKYTAAQASEKFAKLAGDDGQLTLAEYEGSMKKARAHKDCDKKKDAAT